MNSIYHLTKEIANIVNTIYKEKNNLKIKNLYKEGKKLATELKVKAIQNKPKYCLINFKDINSKVLEKKTYILSNLLGKKINQNYKKKKIIVVTPNIDLLKKYKKKINDKLRYHQTNKGGSIHTDGPQINNTPPILLMSCVQNSSRGGDSILVSGEKVFYYIKKNKNKLSKILRNKFYFERRGFKCSNNNIFYKKIFEINKKKFEMRYLREYIDTAYKIKKIQMKNENIKALNYLDRCLNMKKLQTRMRMQTGDVIIINNKAMAHGRSEFTINKKKPRKLLRIWLN
jgi:alpha-ketoglutarate-dependent taurine dioxygenase